MTLFKTLKNSFLVLLFIGLAPLAQANCDIWLAQYDSSAQIAHTYAQPEGYFVAANPTAVDALRMKYLQSKESLRQAPSGDVRKANPEDMKVDLNNLEMQQQLQLRASGFSHLKNFYYFTSGAGLWSRGGSQVKTLVPFNLKSLLDADDVNTLLGVSQIFKASSPEDVLSNSGRNYEAHVDVHALAQEILNASKTMIGALMDKARAQVTALNPVDVKMVNVALWSELIDGFIPFDIWTSQQTHAVTYAYLKELETNYTEKEFHRDQAIDLRIKQSLKRYFTLSRNLGETHIFGYQVGFHALDPQSGQPIPHTSQIGEGAGMAKSYLDDSLRTKYLKERGVKIWVFENLEVVSDMPLLLGAHIQNQAPVSVVVVPQSDGYVGGSPYMNKTAEGLWSLTLFEQSSLPKAFATDNPYFNSNTLFFDFDLSGPTRLGFEVKNAGKEIRPKMNTGDKTLDTFSAGIAGRIGPEYEHFKTFEDYIKYGTSYLKRIQNSWEQNVHLILSKEKESQSQNASPLPKKAA